MRKYISVLYFTVLQIDKEILTTVQVFNYESKSRRKYLKASERERRFETIHDSILESVARTGRLVIVHEAARNCGIGAEIAATVAEHGLYDLHAPIRRVTGYDTITPLSRLEYDYIPSAARIVDAVRSTLAA